MKEQPVQYIEQQPPMTNYPPANYPQQDSKADLFNEINPGLVIEEIYQRLIGNRFNPTQNKWVPDPALKQIALTETGASAITNLMFPASTRNVSISNLKDEEIKKRLYSLTATVLKMMLDNWKQYGIESTSQIYFVKEIVYTNTLVSLKQPENEGIRRLLNSTISENRSVNTYNEEQNSGGFLGLFRKRK